MSKLYVFLALFFISIHSYALCPTNQPMCDVKWQVSPVFIQDGWWVAGDFAISLANPSKISWSIKKNIPYTIRCLISFKNFRDKKDQDYFFIRGWDGVDTSNITFIEGNNEETSSYTPQITLHYEDGYIYFKHVVAINDNASVYVSPFLHKASYACIALEEYPSVR